MQAVDIEIQLQEMRPGDRVRYNGIDWNIQDYSTYQDEEGYQTDEWLLESSGGTQSYLLREYDSNNTLEPVEWYISNPIKNARILLPNSPEDVTSKLWEQMQIIKEPYPELRLFYKSYYFESESEGKHESAGIIKNRITWDYWDQEHITNFAIEAFSDHQLDMYSTKIVNTEKFSQIQKGVNKPTSNWNSNLVGEAIAAGIFFIAGLLFFIFG